MSVLSRVRRSAVVALLAAAMLATFLVSGRGSTPGPELAARSVSRFTPVTGATFNRPIGTVGQQRAIFRQIQNTIAAAPRGSTIKFAVYSFAWGPMTNLLVNAYRRGVHVQLIFDDHAVYGSERRLQKILGKNPRHGSFVVMCRRSCRGTAGQMHDKFFLFDKAGSADHVVMVGSDNITRHNAEDQWSDLYTVVGNRPLFWTYSGIFDEMKFDRPVADSFLSTSIDGYDVQVYPRPGTTEATDPLTEVLSKVDCNQPDPIDPTDGTTGGTTDGTTDGTTGSSSQVLDEYGNPIVTQLRISQHAWNGSRGKYLARQVANLERSGCQVQVIYGVGMGAAVRSILAGSGVELNPGTHKGVRTHQKTLLVSGIYDGDTDAHVVFTGSHNWSNGALNRDETILRINDESAYDQYLANFEDIWANG
jgi:hypothetical protein